MFGFGKKKKSTDQTISDTAATHAPKIDTIHTDDNVTEASRDPEGFYFLTPPSTIDISASGNSSADDAATQSGWLGAIKQRFSKSAAHLSDGITAALTHKRLDDDALDMIEDTLITADCGPKVAAELRERLSKQRYGKETSEDDIRSLLARDIADMLRPAQVPFLANEAHTPHVVLFSGVNGSGKTTTIGKIASYACARNKKVVIAACDTFRAAAEEQIAVWATRSGAELITGKENADPASVAYQAIEHARAVHADLLLIDTAGRLQNKHNLMEQLAKIVRLLKKFDPAYPHESVIVLDAGTGSNGISQIEHFKEPAELTAICMTKLDGTAKGGVLLNAVRSFGLPIAAVGSGESAGDLQAFDADMFATCLTGASLLVDTPDTSITD